MLYRTSLSLSLSLSLSHTRTCTCTHTHTHAHTHTVSSSLSVSLPPLYTPTPPSLSLSLSLSLLDSWEMASVDTQYKTDLSEECRMGYEIETRQIFSKCFDNNNNNECISVALFHVKHAELCWFFFLLRLSHQASVAGSDCPCLYFYLD